MKLSQFLKSCESDEQVDLTHFMILDREQTLCAYCKPPYDMESPRLFFSMTKSIASLAIGLAVEKGFFLSLIRFVAFSRIKYRNVRVRISCS